MVNKIIILLLSDFCSHVGAGENKIGTAETIENWFFVFFSPPTNLFITWLVYSSKGFDAQIEDAQLKHNMKVGEGDKKVPHIFTKCSSGYSSSKSSGFSSRRSSVSSPNTFNYAAMSYASPAEQERDDDSKYFNLLKKFGRRYNCRFNKSGSWCHIMSDKHGPSPLFSFPYTKNDIRNACFLFLNESNCEEMITRANFKLEDHSSAESPQEFKQIHWYSFVWLLPDRCGCVRMNQFVLDQVYLNYSYDDQNILLENFKKIKFARGIMNINEEQLLGAIFRGVRKFGQRSMGTTITPQERIRDMHKKNILTREIRTPTVLVWIIF